MPPGLASAPGSIGKNRPVDFSSSLSCLRVTPACTVTVRSSALTASTRFICDTSIDKPPCTASRWPSSDEPTPNGITGTLYARHCLTASATSSVLRANTTASGGVTGNGDSSRPWCSRTALALLKRSPKRARSASTSVPGSGRFRLSGKARGWFIGVSGNRRAAAGAARRPGARSARRQAQRDPLDRLLEEMVSRTALGQRVEAQRGKDLGGLPAGDRLAHRSKAYAIAAPQASKPCLPTSVIHRAVHCALEHDDG